MAYAPLATPDQLTKLPLGNIVRQFPADQQWNLLVRASRAVETFCQRRLAPFANLVESRRADMVDPVEAWDVYVPLSPQSQMAASRAASLAGGGDLVRHMWLAQYPPMWPDLWQGSITNITILRAIAGSQTIAGTDLATQVQYEQDTGHVRFYYSAYIPVGSTLVATYSGGYNPVPDELVQATLLRAARTALVELEPQDRDRFDLETLDSEIADLLSDYVRDGADW